MVFDDEVMKSAGKWSTRQGHVRREKFCGWDRCGLDEVGVRVESVANGGLMDSAGAYCEPRKMGCEHRSSRHVPSEEMSLQTLCRMEMQAGRP